MKEISTTATHIAVNLTKTFGQVRQTLEAVGVSFDRNELLRQIANGENESIKLQDEVNMLERTRQTLTQELDALKAFALEKPRYSLRKLTNGATVIVHTNDHSAPFEAITCYCPRCFNQSQLEILQPQDSQIGFDFYQCGACKNTYRIPTNNPAHKGFISFSGN